MQSILEVIARMVLLKNAHSIIEPRGSEKAFRKVWPKLIKKIVDPLFCPKREGAIRVISSIEDLSVIRVILEYQVLWLVRLRPPPKITAPPVGMHRTDRMAASCDFSLIMCSYFFIGVVC